MNETSPPTTFNTFTHIHPIPHGWHRMDPSWNSKRLEAIRPFLQVWIPIWPLQKLILEYQIDIWKNLNTCFIAKEAVQRMNLLAPMLKPEVVTILFTDDVKSWQDWIEQDPVPRSCIHWGTKLPRMTFVQTIEEMARQNGCQFPMIWILDNEALICELVQNMELLTRLHQSGITFWVLLNTNSWQIIPNWGDGAWQDASFYQYVAKFEFALVKTHLSTHPFYPLIKTFFPLATTFRWEQDPRLPISKASTTYFQKKTRYLRHTSLARFNLTYKSHLHKLQIQEVGLDP